MELTKYITVFDTQEQYNAAKFGLDYPNVSVVNEEPYKPIFRRTPYDYVEIGGIKWATMNVGATGITDYGLYFQWGDTQGYTRSQIGSGEGKKYFGWADYKYCSGADTSSSAV